MNYDWSENIDTVDWNELVELYHRAPLGTKNPDDLKTVFTNSRYRFFVREHGKLIAVGRALADGADCSYICDVAILPEYQRKGLGKAIILELVKRSKGHQKIILYSVIGKEPFYQKLGFRRMTSAMAIFQNQEMALRGGYISED